MHYTVKRLIGFFHTVRGIMHQPQSKDKQQRLIALIMLGVEWGGGKIIVAIIIVGQTTRPRIHSMACPSSIEFQRPGMNFSNTARNSVRCSSEMAED